MKTSSKKVQKLLLLGATFNTDNMGVGALAAGALTLLHKRYSDADIQFLDYGRTADTIKFSVGNKTLMVPLINLRFSWKLWLPNNIVVVIVLAMLGRCLNQSLRYKLYQTNGWLKTISQADMAFAVSGGDSFSDIYGLPRFFYIILPQVVIALMGIKLILLPQTIGPFKSGVARKLAAQLMAYAELIFARDQVGVRDANDLLKLDDGNAKVKFSHDMGFVLEPHSPNKLVIINAPEGETGVFPAKPAVGLNVSGLLLQGGYTKNNMFNLKVDYRQLIQQLIDRLIRQEQANVLLIPHVFGASDESDTKAIEVVFQTLKDKYPGRLFAVTGNYNQNEIKAIIGRCNFFVGSRMHACIAAISQAVPAVGISYSDKFIGVFDSVGIGHLIADPKQMTTEEIVNLVVAAYQNRALTAGQLKLLMPNVKVGIFAILQAAG